MRILITGGAGFIGSNLAKYLTRNGHNVTVLDSLSPQIHGENPMTTSPLVRSLEGVAKLVVGSVLEKSAWEKVLPNQEAVIHLAAETGTGQSMYEIRRYVDVNVSGTALMLEMLANTEHTIQKVLVASSRAVYGEGKYTSKNGETIYPDQRREEDLKKGIFEPVSLATGEQLCAVATDEDSMLHPTSVYGATKLTQEQLTMTVCQALGISSVGLRYQNVYGPGQSLTNPYTGILSIFSTRIRNGNPVQIFEDGKESRDFVYIDDVVEATAFALLKPAANNQVFGIGSGVSTDVVTVAKRLMECYGIIVPINITGGYRIGDIRHNFADTRKAQELLGFKAKINFDAGVKNFSSWVLSQDIAEDLFSKSIDEMKLKGLFVGD